MSDGHIACSRFAVQPDLSGEFVLDKFDRVLEGPVPPHIDAAVDEDQRFRVQADDLVSAERERAEALFPEAERHAMKGIPHPCNGPARSVLIKAALIGA
jgi:hypothetical protein